jgi:hypothetical protein
VLRALWGFQRGERIARLKLAAPSGADQVHPGLRVALAGAIVMRVTLGLQWMALHWITVVFASLRPAPTTIGTAAAWDRHDVSILMVGACLG